MSDRGASECFLCACQVGCQFIEEGLVGISTLLIDQLGSDNIRAYLSTVGTGNVITQSGWTMIYGLCIVVSGAFRVF